MTRFSSVLSPRCRRGCRWSSVAASSGTRSPGGRYPRCTAQPHQRQNMPSRAATAAKSTRYCVVEHHLARSRPPWLRFLIRGMVNRRLGCDVGNFIVVVGTVMRPQQDAMRDLDADQLALVDQFLLGEI